jgi:hypothetical protein
MQAVFSLRSAIAPVANLPDIISGKDYCRNRVVAFPIDGPGNCSTSAQTSE